jgi:hypothetical protein
MHDDTAQVRTRLPPHWSCLPLTGPCCCSATQLAALCGCPTLSAGDTRCPFCGEAPASGGVAAHARSACARAQPCFSPRGALVLPQGCKGRFFGEAGARLEPCLAWLQRIAGGSAPPSVLRDACVAAVARAAACVPVAPCTALDTRSVDALLRSLQAAASDGSWQRDGLLLLRAHAQLGLPSAELAACLHKGCAAVRGEGPSLLGEVFTQALPAQMWSPLSPGSPAPGMASPAQFGALAARVDAHVDAAWIALQAELTAAAPGLDRALFAEALLDAAAAEGCPMVALYAPMAPCELLNTQGRPTLLDTHALPRVTHARDDDGDDTVEVEPAASLSAPLHPLAGASLSLRDGGLLGRRGHAHAGTSLPVAILSSAAACTPMHVEDWLFASYNAHLHGAPKVWYVVPPANADAFLAAVRGRGGLPPARRPLAAALLATKRLRAELPPEALRELGVRRVVQMPGDIVLTAPVRTPHAHFDACVVSLVVWLSRAVLRRAGCHVSLDARHRLLRRRVAQLPAARRRRRGRCRRLRRAGGARGGCGGVDAPRVRARRGMRRAARARGRAGAQGGAGG